MSDKAKRSSGGLVNFMCPGCDSVHSVRVEGDHAWSWNGSLTAPTFSPSVKVTGVKPLTDDEIDRITRGEKIEPIPTCCHSHVTDGRIDFLPDCTHPLRGSVDLPDWDSKWD